MEGQASISNEILCSYAADAVRDVGGVSGLVDSALHRQRSVRVFEADDGVSVEVQLALDWGASAPDVGREVQRRVREYLARMADLEVTAVDVVVAEIR